MSDRVGGRANTGGLRLAELRGRSLVVATPMYGGMCTGRYNTATIRLARRCDELGIDINFEHTYSESLIPRGRNNLAHRFVASDADHLLFIDADIGFHVESVLSMLELQTASAADSPFDVIAGAYPRKIIAWEKVRSAVQQGKGAERADDLRRYAADLVVNLLPGTSRTWVDEPVEVAEIGAGFMMVRRETLELLADGGSVPSYVPDDLRNPKFDPAPVSAFFDTAIDGSSGRYLSEDYAFCRLVRNAGMHVWFCPWIRLTHMGSQLFIGDPGALQDIGAPATVDRSQL